MLAGVGGVAAGTNKGLGKIATAGDGGSMTAGAGIGGAGVVVRLGDALSGAPHSGSRLDRATGAGAREPPWAGGAPAAAVRLDVLRADGAVDAAGDTRTWDLPARVETALLRARVALALGEVAEAQRWAEQAASWLREADTVDQPQVIYPHLWLPALHLSLIPI